MNLNKLRSLLPLLMEEPFRFDREFDVEEDGHALVVDVQDVSVLRVYQQPHDTWQAADLAEFIVLAKDLMPQLIRAVDYLDRMRELVNDGENTDSGEFISNMVGAGDLLEKLGRPEKQLTSEVSV